jgi:hypothetical protein
MERSVVAMIGCCTGIVHVGARESGITDRSQAVREVFGNFNAADSVVNFWEDWWATVDAPGNDPALIREFVFRDSPARDPTMRFGLNIEQIRKEVYELGNDPAKVNAAWLKVTPDDLVVSSTGALAKWRQDGACGCDVTQLPVPPPAAFDTYEIPPAPPAK